MFRNLHLTNAQTFVLHSFISLLVGALVAGLTAIGQSLFSAGATPPLVLGTGIAAFVAWFTHGFVSLQGNVQTAQAVTDTLAEVKSSIDTLASSHNSLIGFLTQVQQPPAPRPAPPQALPQFVAPRVMDTTTNAPTSIPTMPTGTQPWQSMPSQ